MKRVTKQGGFSLIEVMVAVVILGFLSAAVLSIVAPNIKLQNQRMSLAAFQQDTDWAADQIAREFRLAREIISPADNDQSSLQFINEAGETVTYRIADNVLLREANGRKAGINDPKYLKATKASFRLIYPTKDDGGDGLYQMMLSLQFTDAATGNQQRTVKTSVCTLNKLKIK